MKTKIKCQNNDHTLSYRLRVKILKAPFVDSNILREIVSERARAVVL